MTPGPGIEPGTHWWEASALTTAPTLLPQVIILIGTIGIKCSESLCNSFCLVGREYLEKTQHLQFVMLKFCFSSQHCTLDHSDL